MRHSQINLQIVVAILLFIPFLTFFSCRIFNAITFKQNCSGYLTRAAHANTVSLAKKELTRAVEYAETNKLTEGYTSILYKTPSEDVGFWYTNMKDSLNELNTLPENSSPLEKSNVLIKLRESLQTSTDKGTSLFIPTGITVFPYNKPYALFGLVSMVLIILALILVIETD